MAIDFVMLCKIIFYIKMLFGGDVGIGKGYLKDLSIYLKEYEEFKGDWNFFNG